MIKEKFIKIILAILLLLCLLDMPYGFYQLVRFLALVGFSLLAYQSYEKGNINVVIIYVGLALLFQPLYKVSLGREIWNIVDVIVAVGLIITIFKFSNKSI